RLARRRPRPPPRCARPPHRRPRHRCRPSAGHQQRRRLPRLPRPAAGKLGSGLTAPTAYDIKVLHDPRRPPQTAAHPTGQHRQSRPRYGRDGRREGREIVADADELSAPDVRLVGRHGDQAGHRAPPGCAPEGAGGLMTQKDDWQAQEARLEAYLQRLDVGALRKLILEASWRDDALREKLLMAATVAESTGLSDLRKVVKQATRTNGFIEYREAGAYANRLEDLGELLSQRIADGEEELIEVIEEAIALAEEALEHIDDSGGEVMPAVVELRRVHLAACNALHPDPVALAERLYGFQMNGQWDTFHEVLPDYAEALGEEGLAEYRQRVERDWVALPTLGP